MRMRSSLLELERKFHRETQAEAREHEELLIEVDQRAERRYLQRTHKAGSLRFALLVLILVGTAALVTIAMFQTLYLVMG